MTTNNPCAVYNFYNCCNGNGTSTGPAEAAPFIWQSGFILDPTRFGASTQEPLSAVLNFGNTPNAALKAYVGLLPLHRKAQLKEITILRFPEAVSGASTPYTASINFDLIVLDYNGALLRPISTVTLDYRALPIRTWIPITPLSTVAGALDIMPGELIAGQLTFGAALPAGVMLHAIYQLSGTGILLP